MHPRFLNAVAATYSAAGSGWSGWSFAAQACRALEIRNNRIVECLPTAPFTVADGGVIESAGYGTTPGKAGASLGVASNVLQSFVLIPGCSSMFPSVNDIAENLTMDPALWAVWRSAYPLEVFSDVVDVPLAMIRAYDPSVVPGTQLEYVRFTHTAPGDPTVPALFSFFAAGSRWHAATEFDFEVLSLETGQRFAHVDPATGASETRFNVNLKRDMLTRVDLSLWAPAGITATIEIHVFPRFPADPVPSILTAGGGAIVFPRMHVGMSIGGWSLCNGGVKQLQNGFGIGAFGIGAFGGVI